MTDVEWDQFLDFVPWQTDRAVVQARVDGFDGSWQAAALAYTRRRLSEILSSPTSFSVPDYSESWTGNVSELREREAKLAALVPAEFGGSGASVGRVVRSGRGRSSGYR